MVLVADYARAMRVRSPRWGTVHLAGADFQRLSTPFFARGPGTSGQDKALQSPGVPVASGL